jgi:hypothetical protein
MKIDAVSYGNQVYPAGKPVKTHEQTTVSEKETNTEVFTSDEERYFEKIYPDTDVARHVRNAYTADGKSAGSLGNVIDRKG